METELDDTFTVEPFMIIDGLIYTADNFTLPPDMRFGEAQIISIFTYSTLFVIGLTFNTISLYQLVKERVQRKIRNKMNLLLIHLAIADLVVILFQVPLEVAWTYTVSWTADDITCRIMVFIRIIGFYLSSFIMIVISIDRLYAILSQTHKTKMMLTAVWIAAPLCSLPQSFLFQLKHHPLIKDYYQCTTIGSFQSETMEFLYFVFVFTLTWLFPLIVMISCYVAIIIVIYKRSRNFTTDKDSSCQTSRINDYGVVGKAKIKTIKITGVLVLGFILCWTPYNLMYVWFFVDKESANRTDFRFQKLLYAFACANNCLNPLLYRMVGKNYWRKKNLRNSREDRFQTLQLSRTRTHTLHSSADYSIKEQKTSSKLVIASSD